MKRFFPPFAVALALTLTAAAQSRADLNVWYNWESSPGFIQFVPQFPQSPGQMGTGGISLLDLNSQAIEADATIGTGAPAVNLQVISTAQPAGSSWAQGVDVIPHSGGQYTLTLKLYAHDPAHVSGQTPVTVSFTGKLSGFATGLAAHLDNGITSSTDSNGTVHHYTLDANGNNLPGTQVFATAMVGNNPIAIAYSLSHGFAESGNPEEHAFGAVSFDIQAGVPIGGNPTPEPSSMILGCLGLSFVGGIVWRARRRKLAALKALA